MKQVLALLLAAVLASAVSAQDRGVSVQYRASEASNAPVAGQMQLYSKSYALVVGIDNYENGWPRLSNAVADAKKVAGVLEEQGFEVTLKTNLKSRELSAAFEDFFIDKGGDEEARLFVWYAGHGDTVGGEGYLIPADGVLAADRSNFLRRAVSLREFGRYVRLAASKHVYTVFDSCFAGTIFNVARSAPPPAITRITSQPVRQFLSSGDAGQTVSDDGTFANLFVEALKGERRADLNTDGYVTAEEMGSFLTTSVSNYTNNKQVPRYGKLQDPGYDKGDFVFLTFLTHALPAMTGPTPGVTDFNLGDIATQAEADRKRREAWTKTLDDMRAAFGQVRDIDSQDVDIALKIAAWQRFTQVFGEDNPYASEDNDMRGEGRSRIRALQAEQKLQQQQLAIVATPSGGALSSLDKACDVCPEMVLIPAGSFRMGDLDGGGSNSEKPVRHVEIRAFALGKYEVTFDEYDAFARAAGRQRPSNEGWGRGNRPVIHVSWEDAKAYAKWLSQKTGLNFRLPSEAEWEYAARAGTTTRYSFGNDDYNTCEYANHSDRSADHNWRNTRCSDGVGKQTASVGSYRPNAFGLYDMHGNVWEWTADCYNDSYFGAPTNGSAWTTGSCKYRVLRGGAWYLPPAHLRSAHRHSHTPDGRGNGVGFRVAQDL